MKKAVGYIRVSNLMGRDDLMSPDIQKAQIEAYCKSKDYKIIDFYEDLDISGRIADRPQFQKMLSSDGYDLVVVYRLSRFMRNAKEALNIIDQLKEKGSSLESATEGITSGGPMGNFLRNFLIIVAEWESERISETWKQSFAQKVNAGRWRGSRPPFGYDSKNSRLVMNPEQANTVQWIFNEFVNNGTTLTQLMAHFNQNGVKLRNGLVDLKTIKYILTNPVYIGKMNYQGREYQGIHKPLISEDVFQKAREKLASRPKCNWEHNLRYELSGIVYCSSCGMKMAVHDLKKITIMECKSRARRTRCAKQMVIVYPKILEEVEKKFIEYIRNFDISEIPIKKEEKGKAGKIKRKLLYIEKEKERLFNLAIKSETMDPALFDQKNRELAEEENRLKNELNAVATRPINIKQDKVDWIADNYFELTKKEKNEILRLWIKGIEVYPKLAGDKASDRIKIEFLYPK